MGNGNGMGWGFGVVPSMRLFRERGIEDVVVPLSYAACACGL